MMRIAISWIVLVTSTACGGAAERATSGQEGRSLVAKMCASCHAIGRTDISPNLAAPAFRNLDRQLDLDSFADRLRRGLMSGHDDMPLFRFSRDDARAIVSYLRSIQTP